MLHGGADCTPAGPSGASVRSFFVQKSSGRPGLTYEAVQKLGEGAFGVAHLVRDKRTGQMRVLKTINKRQSQVPPAQMETEIRNLKACDHPHIIRLFEYYEDYENIYLIMERAAGGELHQVLQEQRKKGMQLPERWVSIVTRQCLQAIAYVHSMGIIHKDLKSENILLLHDSDVNDPSVQPHAVIIDLGIAELFAARLGRRARCTVVAGTPTHMAPEVWRGNFGPVADVWSLGVVVFELLSGELPFMCSSLNSAAEWVRLHRQGPNWSLLSQASAQARALNQRMLSVDERMRPTTQQCLTHAWLKEDSSEALSQCAPPDVASSNEIQIPNPSPRSPRSPLPADNTSERLRKTLHTYHGRSKFEKTLLLQVASQLHTSQVSQIGQMFMAADRNGNGSIDKTEMLSVLRKLGAEGADAESYMQCLDADGNGQVEYTEFAAGCVDMLWESLRDLLWQSFCVLDVDGNGVLSRDEVYNVVTRAELQQYGFPCEGDKGVSEALQRMDVDKNGQISFDELCRHFLPPTPSLPSSSPRTKQVAAASGPYAPQSAAVASSAKAPAPVKQVPTLKDEDFTQLLDEIEADCQSSTRGEARADPLPAFEQVPAAASSHLAVGETSPLFDLAATEFGVPSQDTFSMGPTTLQDSLLSIPSNSQNVVPPPTPAIPSAAEVDDELTRMLAEMANGP